MLKHAAQVMVALMVGSTAMLSQTAWKLDKSHTAIRFHVSHLVISEVTGLFKEYDVTLTQPNQDFTDATLEVTIRAASIFSDNERRDKDLTSADFLDAENFPDITFKSTSFAKVDTNSYKIAGNLTIRGVTKQVVLDAVYKGELQMRGRRTIAFSATTEINRFDFGVKWDAKTETGGLVAGEKVRIDVTYEGRNK